MLSFLVELLNFIIDVIALLGQILILCGYSIAYILYSFTKFSLLVFNNILIVIHVLFEDLGKFLVEAIDITEEISCEICTAVEHVKNILENTCGTNLIYVVDWIVQTFKSFLYNQIIFFWNIAEFIKILLKLIIDALTLIGSVSRQCLNLSFVAIYNVITAPITSFIIILTASYDIILTFFTTIIHLPVESAIGFCVLLSIGFLYHKYNGNRLVKKLFKFIVLIIVRSSIFTITLLIIFKWYLFRFFKYIKQWTRILHKERSNLESPSKVELIKKLEQEISLRMCVICMSNPREVMIVNCNHFCMCYTCAKQVRQINNECPVCRKYIYGLSGKVFM